MNPTHDYYDKASWRDLTPLFASTIPPEFLAGSVALISQSGALSTTIANALMLNRHVGLSHSISCGNQAGATIMVPKDLASNDWNVWNRWNHWNR